MIRVCGLWKKNDTEQIVAKRPGRKRGMKNAVFLLTFLTVFGGARLAWAGQAVLEDRASLLSQEEKQNLEQQAKALAEDTGYDIMVISTDDAGGKEAMDYAEDFYMDHKNTLDGAAYLIDMDNREIYVATSGDMRYLLDDDRIEKILDDAYAYVSEGQYGDGFAVMLEDTERFVEQVILEGAYTRDVQTGEIVRYQEPKSISLAEFLVALAAGLGAGGLFFGATVGKYKLKFGKYSYSYRDNSELKLNRREDQFINRVVTKRPIPKNTSSSGHSGGSHRSSGSSVHKGSGGNSFGGGGRKF